MTTDCDLVRGRAVSTLIIVCPSSSPSGLSGELTTDLIYLSN